MVALKIAMRFLRSSKVQTILIVLGIAVGVSVQVFVGSLISSLQSDLLDRTVGGSAQITVTPGPTVVTIDDWQAKADKLGNISSITAVSVSADSPAFLKNGTRTSSILIRGVEFDQADRIYRLDSALLQGRYPSSGLEVAVGKDLAKERGIGVGSVLNVTVPSQSTFLMTVVGIYDLKVKTLNDLWVFTPLATAQGMFDYGGNVTSMEMKVTDVFKVDTVTLDVKAALAGSDVKVVNWKEQNAQLLSGLQAQSISSIMIQGFVLVSVVIAIASILAIRVLQRSRQIGILKAMGIKDREASLIFILEGSFLGILGSVLGAILGILLVLSFSVFAHNADGTAVINIQFDSLFILLSTAIAIMSAILASALPARRSSKLSPIEVIRNG